jgi:predicted acylesterase/phospholipase RssA
VRLLKATSALPGLFNGKVAIGERRYIDGGFVDPLPLNRLLSLGVAQVVAVCTSPIAYSFVNDSWPRRTVIKSLSIGQSRHVRSWIGTPNPLHDENLEALLLSAEGNRPANCPPVYVIAPPIKYPDFTRSAALLHEMFEMGRTVAADVVGSIQNLGQSAPARDA